jgi:hypothetical protein
VSSLQQRETFRTSRLLAFASERELTAQIGHRREQWPRVAVKELVDNAIDACEERGIPPEIRVRVAHDRIEVGDNGPGIAEDVVADVLDFAVRVSSREAYVGPTRGAQGNALKTLVAMPFALDGERGLVEIESLGVLHRLAFAVDRIAQEPQAERSTKPSLVRNGTVVRIRWPDSASSILAGSRDNLWRDLYRFAVFNPHLALTADLFGEPLDFRATNPGWRKWRPHDPLLPQWFDHERFTRLLAAILHHDRTRNGRIRLVSELLGQFRGLSGTAKQKRILGALGLAWAGLDALVRDGGITSVKVVEIRGRSAVAIGQAAWGGTSEGGLGVASPSISGGASSAIASTCM